MFKSYKNTPYDIYEDGRCYSHRSNKFLTPKMSITYPTYNLIIDGKKKSVKVHRMVAETFIPQPEGKNIVNHIDGDTHNYHISNLEWVTSSENSQHAVNTGLRRNGEQVINKYTGNLPNEEWMPVVNYSNYVISSVGRVMNINTKRILKSYYDNTGGYECINLWKDGQGKTLRVHQLVYSHFNNDFNLKGYVINHKDGNKKNNDIKNLEKTTYQKNNLHAVYEIKTNKCTRRVIQYDLNGNEIARYNSLAEASRMTGASNINRAIKRNGNAGGYIWKYE